MHQKRKRGGLASLFEAIIFSLLLFSLFGPTGQALATGQRDLESYSPGLGLRPTILTIHPQAGRPGDIVYIYGENFGQIKEDGEVRVYGQPAEVALWRHDIIAVFAPMEIEGISVPVQIVSPDSGSNMVFFDYLGAHEYPLDLALSISPKSSYMAGEKNIRIPVTISAKGAITQESLVTSRIYLARGKAPDPEDILLWEKDFRRPTYFSETTNKKIYSELAVLHIPEAPPGKYYLLAAADWYGQLKESDEENNWVAAPVKIVSAFHQSPVAGITVSAQGKIAYEGETLSLFSTNPGGLLTVYFSANRSVFSGHYAQYRWWVDNRPVASGPGFSYQMKSGSHRVSLEITDRYRRKSTAGTKIVVGHGPDWLDQGPFVPLEAGQFEADGVTPLAYHDITYKNMVILKARVVNPNGNPVMLQAELREMGESFTGEATRQTPFYVASGEEAFVALPGIFPGSYRWRLRAVDSKGGYSPWICLDPYNASFYIMNPETP